MRKNAKILMVVSVLSISMLIGVSSVMFMTKSGAADPTALTVGTAASFKYNNDSQIASYSVSLTKDTLYEINITNDNGVVLAWSLVWPDNKVEYSSCLLEGVQEITNQIDSGSQAWPANWVDTQTQNFYAVQDLKLVIYITAMSKNNVTVKWADVGGKVLVTDISSKIDTTATATGWSLDLKKMESKFAKVEITEDGWYAITLNATKGDVTVGLAQKNKYMPLVSTIDNMNDDNNTWSTMGAFRCKYICKGTYYLMAQENAGEPASFALTITKDAAPAEVAPDGTVDVEIPASSLNKAGTTVGLKGVTLKNMEKDVLYEYSLTCPAGFSWNAMMGPAYENQTSDASYLWSEIDCAPGVKYNGVEMDKQILTINGYDALEMVNPKTIIRERFYQSGCMSVDGCSTVLSGSLSIRTALQLVNVTSNVNYGTPKITVSLKKAAEQPVALPTAADLAFKHQSGDDDEGIYLLPQDAIGSVLGITIESMSNNAILGLDFIAKCCGNNMMISEQGGASMGFANDTFKLFEEDKFMTEMAVLKAGFVIIEDSRSWMMYDSDYNTTSVKFNVNITKAVSLDKAFEKKKGQDLVLVDTSLDCCCQLAVVGINGIPDITASWVVSKDCCNDVSCNACKGSSWVVILLDTGVGGMTTDNVGTFKVVKICKSGGIDGFPIAITITIAAVAIALLSFKLRKTLRK